MKLSSIQAPIEEELSIFEKKMKEAMKSRVPMLDRISHYIINKKGKQIRPMFVFLSAKIFGKTNESTYIAATMIELLHTATLVHDDVVDDSMFRRSFFSINALWKNKIAVLVGDYLLSKGLLVSLENNQFKLLQIMAESVREMSEGELLQIEKARKLDITEEVYYEIISKKTASLLTTACAVGCASVSDDDSKLALAKKIGYNIGMAFQMKDDLFDYSNDDIGKPTGIDIKERKMTLPLIYTLQKVSLLERNKIKYLVKYQNTNEKSVKYILQKVHESGGIQYTEQKMNEYIQSAYSVLDKLEESDAKSSMMQLIDFTINRKI